MLIRTKSNSTFCTINKDDLEHNHKQKYEDIYNIYNPNANNEINKNRTMSNIKPSRNNNNYFTLLNNKPSNKNNNISQQNTIFNINSYLLSHNNRLMFEVREKKNNTYYVSVINAYYRSWVKEIETAIKKEEGIQVHIDALVSGGYTCHTYIVPLVELTGRLYTQSVFIPGSLIVLNIERDFERWIGEDVVIVPQNFVDFRTNKFTGEKETSLVGSRKRVLQIIGMRNLEEYYKQYQLVKQTKSKYDSGEIEGIVTGIINSNNKTGIFVELVDKFITGFAEIDSADLLDYLPGDTVYVKIKEFEVQEGKEPFLYYKGRVSKSNTRIVFDLAS